MVSNRGLTLVSDDNALAAAVDAVLGANPDLVAKIRGGKAGGGRLIGQVMKAMRGQADAARIRALILEKLG